MIKQNKKLLIITSLVMLIPVIVGLLIWDRLPDPMPTHWGINGEVDGWSSKAFTIFGLPAFLLLIHWLCIIASSADPKSQDYHPKMLKLVLWICPVVSLVIFALVYGAALGYDCNIEVIMPLLVGVMFIVIGNWLPKCKQTYTMGIKLPWTYASEANWNATHRFGGKIWFWGGVATMLTAIRGNFWVLMVILAAMVILPTVYSYRYYVKYEKEEKDGN